MRRFAKGFKKAIAMMLILTMVMANFMVVVAAEEPDEEPDEPIAVFEEQELIWIPIREVLESIGLTVDWNDENRSIVIDDFGGSEVVLYVNRYLARINGEYLPLQHGVIIISDLSFMTLDDLVLVELTAAGLDGGLETFYLTEEARDLALYDFDYMIAFVLENTALDSVISRRIGTDFAEIVDIFRDAIYNMEPLTALAVPELFPIRDGDDARSLAANYLISLLAFGFAPSVNSIGHLGPRDLDAYRQLLTAFTMMLYDEDTDPGLVEWFEYLISVYTSPQAIWFYGEYEVNLDADHAFPDVPGNIVTEIIVPGEVAFLRINSFWANPEYDDYFILPFLQYVADFDHLILDVRGNTGGLASYFDEFITARLLSEPVEVSSWEFFRAGELARSFNEGVLSILQSAAEYADSGIIYASIMPAAEFVSERGMIYFSQDDLVRLDYVRYTRSIWLPGDESIGFTGQIWLLIDGMSFSASELAAVSVVAMGGTLVGENTGGVTGVSHTYIALPNTGIIWRVDIGYTTDALGRSFEVYGTTPHYFNLPGMDALATVLAIIAERNLGEIVEVAYIPEALIGHWECQNDERPHADFCTFVFFEDGRFHDHVDDWGYFSVVGDYLILYYDEFGGVILEFVIEGDLLIITIPTILTEDGIRIELERQ